MRNERYRDSEIPLGDQPVRGGIWKLDAHGLKPSGNLKGRLDNLNKMHHTGVENRKKKNKSKLFEVRKKNGVVW